MPDSLMLRMISFCINIPGIRTKNVTVITTLVDPKAFPKDAFVELYRKRWMAELFLKDIKISLGMDVLKCKSPAMVHKELRMHIIAYNIIRNLMLKAGNLYGVTTFRMSFKGTIDTLREWSPIMRLLKEEKGLEMMKLLLKYLAEDIVPYRPNRNEPRTRKRRPKNYQLMNKPRGEFKEIFHRNRYKKLKLVPFGTDPLYLIFFCTFRSVIALEITCYYNDRIIFFLVFFLDFGASNYTIPVRSLGVFISY